MSNNVDQRIVEMQFNNKQFESGIQTSLKSLDQLEKGLQLDGAADGLKELDRATKSFSFANMANGIDFIASKFTGLGILGVTAMQNIANSVWRTGTQMAKSFTTEPIKAGFSEYETQINAIQTILANTQNAGKTLPDVTKALDELNAYADKTIYNFTEMTRNIGTFTAAGVDLDVATNSIQGIANLAAISGSTSQQASTAMYQLSQAMAAGTVKLMDWNSVVNAGMGGQVFQDALKETARAHNIAIDDMIEKHGSFRETLQEGWITTDVLTETLEKFTATTEGLTEEQIQANREMWKARGYTEEQIDAIFEMGKTATDAATKVKTFTQLFDTLKEAAQSGWTQSWEILVGDFEEAKFLLTAISDEMGAIINQSAEARNTMLQGWKDAGGRDDVIEGLKNLYQLLCDIIEPARQAFEEIFPPLTSDQLKGYTQAFEDFTQKLKITPDIADRLKRSFKGFFALIDIGAQFVSALAGGFADLVGFSLPIGGNLLDMTASLGDFLVELSNASRETGFFEAAMDAIGDGVELAAGAFEKLTSKGAELFEFFEGIDLSGIEVKIEPLKALGEAGAWVLEKLQAAYEKALPFLSEFGGYVSDAFGEFATAIDAAIKDGSFDAVMGLVNSGMLAGLVAGISKIAKSFANIGENAGGFLGNLSGILEGLTGSLEAMQSRVKADALKSIAIAIGILAASLAVLSMLDGDNLGAAFAAITAMFIELTAALFAVTAIIDGLKMGSLAKTVTALKGMATAILILSAAMAIMGTMDTDSVATGLIAVISLMGMMTLVTEKLSSSGGKLMQGAGSMIAFAVAIGILAASVKTLGELDIATIVKGLVAVGAVMGEIALFAKVYDFGSIGISAGVGLMAMATAMFILSSAIRNMGSMDIVTIAKGLLVMASGLIALVIAAEAMPDNMLSIGFGLMAMATAIAIVGAALHIMGALSIGELVTGLVAMGGALAAMVIAANAMKGSIAGAGAMLIMAGAITVLGVALHILGALSIGELVTSLVALAGSLAIMGFASAALAPLVPAMLALSVGILAFSVAVGVGGVALLAFGAGLTATGAGIAALVAGIIAALTTIGSAIPVLAEQLGAAVVAIADAIIAAAPACDAAATAVMQAIINVIAGGISAVAAAIVGVGPALLQLAGYLMVLGAAAMVLQPMVPAIVALGVALGTFGAGCGVVAAAVLLLAGALELLGLSGVTVAAALSDIYTSISSMSELSMDAVIDSADVLMNAGKKAAEYIMKGLDDGLSGSDEAMGALVQAMISEAEGATGDFSGIGEALAGSFTTALQSSLQNGVSGTTASLTSAMSGMVSSCVGVLSGSYSQFHAIGATMINRLAAGVSSKRSTGTSAVSSVASSMASTVGGYYDDFYDAGGDMVRGLADGLYAYQYLATNAASALGNATKNAMKRSVDSNSPSKDFQDIGMWCDMGLANGLTKFAKLASNASKYLGNQTLQPIMSMTETAMSDLTSMGRALRGTSDLASSLDSCITCEQYVTVTHSFEDLTVRGVNDRNEFVAVANYSVEEMMTELMRKGLRR
ncbi:MAG: tape measure protein [Oscillospiraceae bacterium]|nr:tape measure protein [Oscillospiraceae bacterium]